MSVGRYGGASWTVVKESLTKGSSEINDAYGQTEEKGNKRAEGARSMRLPKFGGYGREVDRC